MDLQIHKNKRDLECFLKTGVVHSVLNRFTTTLADSEEQKKGRLTINSGPDCYTNLLNIVVGMLPYFLKEDFGKDLFGQELNRIIKKQGYRGLWLIIYKAEFAHEMQHKNSTREIDAAYCRNEIAEYLYKNFGIHKSIGINFGADLFNIVEDGRIESIIIQKYIGMKMSFLLLNSQIRNGCTIKKIPENPLEEYKALNRCILSYAKTGYLPKGQQYIKNTRVNVEFMKIKKYIDLGVEGVTCGDCANACISLVKEIGPYLADLLRADSNLVHLLEKLFNKNTYSNNEKDFNQNNSQNPLRKSRKVETQQGDGDDGDSNYSEQIVVKTNVKAEASSDKNSQNDNNESNDASSGGKSNKEDKNDEENKADNENQDNKSSGSTQDKKSAQQTDNDKGSSDSKDDSENKAANTDSNKKDNEDSNSSKDSQKEDLEEENKSKSNNKENEENDEKDEEDEEEIKEEYDDKNDEDDDKSKAKNKDSKASSKNDSNPTDEDSKGENSNSKENDISKNNDNTDSKSKDMENEDGDMGEGCSTNDEESGWTNEELSKFEELLERANQEAEREEVIITKKDAMIKGTINNQDISSIKSNYKNDFRSVDFQEIPYDLQPTDIPLEIKAIGAAFKRDIEKILFIKNGRQKGLKRGILDTTSLWKIGVRDGNIFSKKSAHTKDFAFYLLQDGSGSMGGTKEYESAKTLSILEEGLREYSALKITTFAADRGKVLHYTAKQFDDNRKFNHSYSFLGARRSGGSNKDGYSIRVATKELLKRSEQKKVLFVLSDGLPSEYSGGFEAAKEDVKKAVEEARSKGIEVIAVMFGTDNFIRQTKVYYEYMYKHSVISCNPTEIGKKLMPILKTIVKR